MEAWTKKGKCQTFLDTLYELLKKTLQEELANGGNVETCEKIVRAKYNCAVFGWEECWAAVKRDFS